MIKYNIPEGYCCSCGEPSTKTVCWDCMIDTMVEVHVEYIVEKECSREKKK